MVVEALIFSRSDVTYLFHLPLAKVPLVMFTDLLGSKRFLLDIYIPCNLLVCLHILRVLPNPTPKLTVWPPNSIVARFPRAIPLIMAWNDFNWDLGRYYSHPNSSVPRFSRTNPKVMAWQGKVR